MRFGVILPIQSKDAGLDVLWEELREEVATAEEAGFDAVFMTEFHQARGRGVRLSAAARARGCCRGRRGSGSGRRCSRRRSTTRCGSPRTC